MFHDRTKNNRINKSHERALRIVYRDTESSFDELLAKDNSVSVHQRNLQLLIIEIFKTKNNKTFLSKEGTSTILETMMVFQHQRQIQPLMV